jgi:threonine/homoserine/homoserine lactone efflux protein
VRFSHAATAFGVGAALGAIPGPVQVLILSESARGGASRGLRAMAGANATFGVLLLLLAAGLSAIAPSEAFLRVVKLLGGAFLVYLGVDGLRTIRAGDQGDAVAAPRLHPAVRGILAVLLNPGVYIFLATTASAIVADAADEGGRSLAYFTVLSMLRGVLVVDLGALLIGAGSRRAFGARVLRALGALLAVTLIALGVVFIVLGIMG